MGRNVDGTLELVGKLTAEGIPATADPRDVNPPCVLVGPPAIEDGRTVCGGAFATWTVLVVGTNPANLDSWVALDDLVDRCRGVLLPDREDPGQWQPSSDRQPLPCYTLTVTGGL